MSKHIQTKETRKKNSNNEVTKKQENQNNNVKKKPSKKNIQKKRRRRTVLLILLVLFIALGVFIGVRIHNAGGNLLAALMGHNKYTRENLDKLQVLILGESTGMSDTIVVAQYDPKTQEAALLSVPRDTFVGTNINRATSNDKINAKYSHGETPQETIKAVNELTGLNIEKYILVDTKALNKLVDVIGGLDFNVPMDMNYDDDAQDLHIHLTAGQQKLTGNQVEQLVRFRHNNDGSSYYKVYGVGEDFGRMRTQREAIIALGKQSLKLKNVTEIFKIIDILKSYVKTNINLDEIKDYVPYAIEMNMDNIKTGQVPGSDGPANIGVYVFNPDREATKELVQELFYGITPDQEEDGNNTVENNAITND